MIEARGLVKRFGGRDHRYPARQRQPAPVLPVGEFAVFGAYTVVLLAAGALLFARNDA